MGFQTKTTLTAGRFNVGLGVLRRGVLNGPTWFTRYQSHLALGKMITTRAQEYPYNLCSMNGTSKPSRVRIYLCPH
jgi:hypothetical protein